MKKEIAQIDKNFAVRAAVGNDEALFYNVRNEPFAIYGLYEPKKTSQFVRLPAEVAKSVSEGVEILAKNTSGGRVRFKTDSKLLAIRAEMNGLNLMPHMTLAGSSGFDVYTKRDGKYVFSGTLMPEGGVETCTNVEKNGGYTAVLYFPDNEMRDITINFPLYNEVNNLFIGLEPGARLEAGDKYTDIPPVVYYGSSITQGGCASRPGNNYCAVISRKYDTDFCNLGFSGNAKGEKEIADYIAGLAMSAFVYAYDHNAPTAEHLEKTHAPMYKIIREKNPHIPIVFITRPRVGLNEDEIRRREIVYKTYSEAKAAGDPVYFVDGEKIFEVLGGDSGSVDGTHPNDLGFMCVAAATDRIMKEIFDKICHCNA